MGMSGPSREGGMMAEINVTPFVDVMLVLLIIFMVTAPLMATGVEIDLPSATAPPAAFTARATARISPDTIGKMIKPSSRFPIHPNGKL